MPSIFSLKRQLIVYAIIGDINVYFEFHDTLAPKD